jgi:hypothetical protein
MPGWLVVVLLLIAFLTWAGWVLNKRSSPHRPEEGRSKQDFGGFGGSGGP